MTWVLAGACALGAIPAGLRWLRIAQREHYLPPAVSRFAWRWWTVRPLNVALLLTAVAGVAGSYWDPRTGLLVVFAQLGPVGLSVRGVTSPLVWTARLRRLAGVAGALFVGSTVAGALVDLPIQVAATLLAMPVVVDVALALMRPVEERIGSKWVSRAASKLASIGADVVAITGSYGKTTTKVFVAHLLGGTLRTVASPASFNNRMGLARSINESLTPGTEVFVAEMGTYGPGEIARLTSWIPPRVAAIVAIGPVHLERFKSEERIVQAKSEILDLAQVGVICIDHPLLRDLARARGKTMEIIEVSAGEGRLVVDGEDLGPAPPGGFGTNAAVALGVGKALGVEPGLMRERIPTLPRAAHRLSVEVSSTGVTIIDDTFNSNPAGARSGLALLVGAGVRKAVVTPGMVELGQAQARENESFARDAASVADHLVVVGLTNRKALLKGAAKGEASVTVVRSRDEAVAWVRGNLVAGDAVLYENDLPDHYP